MQPCDRSRHKVALCSDFIAVSARNRDIRAVETLPSLRLPIRSRQPRHLQLPPRQQHEQGVALLYGLNTEENLEWVGQRLWRSHTWQREQRKRERWDEDASERGRLAWVEEKRRRRVAVEMEAKEQEEEERKVRVQERLDALAAEDEDELLATFAEKVRRARDLS